MHKISTQFAEDEAARGQYAGLTVFKVTIWNLRIKFPAGILLPGPFQRLRTRDAFPRRNPRPADIEVVPQSRQSFLNALSLYEARHDKA